LANQHFLELRHRPGLSGFNFGEVEFCHGKRLSWKEKVVPALYRLLN